jgi:hypothetical protein
LASALCKARAARKCGGYGPASIGVPLSFFFFLTFVAQSADREVPVTTAGILWRRSVRRAKKFPSRDDDSGADRIARTMKRVIAGHSLRCLTSWSKKNAHNRAPYGSLS